MDKQPDGVFWLVATISSNLKTLDNSGFLILQHCQANFITTWIVYKQ